MARGRHVRRSGLLSRLWPRRRRSRVAVLEREVARLRALNHAAADASTAAVLRASAAADAAAAAEVRALRAEVALGAARDEVAALRADLAALREELVWAFAARAAEVKAGTVIDLTDEATQTA